MQVFNFLSDQLLKMVWLEQLVNWLLLSVFGMNGESLLFKAISFFLFDTIKIFILLSILIYLSSYIQSYFSPERTKKILSKMKGFQANLVGALLGTLTPFCSCSSIPIFIGFTKAGLPIGVTFSFLISSPLVDLASVILIASIFGWTVALLYVLVGIILAVVGGTIISIMKMEKYVEEFVFTPVNAAEIEEAVMTKKDRRIYALDQVKEIIHRVWKYILWGVGIGAIIHGFIPQTFVEAVLGENNPFSVIIATLLGIPMYADIFGTLPIASALVLKGVGLGTVLSFMMAVTALSLPSLILLKKVVKTKLLVLFVGIVTVGIIFIGYLFNYLLPLLV